MSTARQLNIVLAYAILCVSLMAGGFLFFNKPIYSAEPSSDAIAIRVIPNQEHLSARLWYGRQGFTGSPQSLTVDGYEAVRDGRTVYVNVGNVDGSNLWTNIYLISYNQQAEKITSDVFGQLLKHWKFNTNLNLMSGFCRKDATISCQKDESCPIGDFCDSPKARVIRDTRRLSDLADLQSLLDSFNAQNGHYPILSAGTYLANRTISVWPSWLDAFRKELGTNPPVDPVNAFEKCPDGYDGVTCWNEAEKRFPTTLPNLPAASNGLVYIYLSDPTGLSGTVCGVFESGYTISPSPPDCVVKICLDFDRDGYGSPGSADCPNGSATDCNDTDTKVHAGSAEICDNHFDDDCDGLVDCWDDNCFANPSCTAFVCHPDGCGNGCPSFCTKSQDLDCGPPNCVPGNGCCEFGCTFASGDTDCPPTCSPNGCGGGCPPGCGPSDDPDCAGCVSGNSCCTAGCTRTLGDLDCPEECVDADHDGYNAYNAALCPSGNDCDDGNNNIYPGHSELCDGLDNDCDDTNHSDGITPSSIDDGLSEEQCSFVCAAHGYVWTGLGDPRNCCGNNSATHEGNPYQNHENNPPGFCSDGNDNDCDGLIDILDSDCSTLCGSSGENDWYVFSQGDCDQCDHAGDDDGDQPGDWGVYSNKIDACDSDCGIVSGNTVTLSKFEPVSETSCDGLDNDCDGTIDEGLAITYYRDSDNDNYGDPLDSIVACPSSPPSGYVADGSDCDDGNSSVHPWATEICEDGIDNDCVGGDYSPCPPPCDDSDGDGYGVCPKCGTANSCTYDGEDCDDTRIYVHPGLEERCDGFDNDCDDPDHSDGVDPAAIDEGCNDDGDGYCDEDFVMYNTPLSLCPLTVTANGNYGNDCLDNPSSPFAATTYPGAVETCNGNDDDCDKVVDDGFSAENCQPVCELGGFIWTGNGDPINCCGNNAGEGEYPEASCEDGIDNDCDGSTDCEDSPDCDEACKPECTFIFEFPCEF